jgi:hypothetical protein
MTTYHHRRAAFTFTALLLAGMTLGAPMALAATPRHAPPPRSVWLYAQPYGTVRATAPHFSVTESHMADPFANLHQE